MLKGFVCPPISGEEPGRKNELKYCVSGCKAPCTSGIVLSAIVKHTNDNPHTGQRISATMICGGCSRKSLLERTVDYYIEPSQGLPTLRGSLLHAVIEQGKSKELSKNYLIEQHMELPVTTKSGSWTLSATIDLFDKKRKTLYDTKTLQTYSVEKLVKGQNKGTWSDHISDQYVKQLNIYRYVGEKTKLFKAKKLRLQIIDFGRLILTGTTVGLKTQATKWKEELYEVPNVPILPDSLVEEWINTQGDKWYRILFMNEPAPVYDDGYDWLCKSCQFYQGQHCVDPHREKELEKELGWFDA